MKSIIPIALFGLSILSLFTIPILFPVLTLAAFSSLGLIFAGCCIVASSLLGLGIYSKKKRRDECQITDVATSEYKDKF